jgi:uncharacterized repeat protein (TIGR01451 family)
MKKRFFLAVVAVAALLPTMGLLLQPALAGPCVQEDTPLLEILKTAEGDGTIAPGQTVHYTITVRNTGETTATNVTVQDDYDQLALPTIEVLSDVELGPGSAQNDGDVIAWQLGDLEPAAQWSASYKATAATAFQAGSTEVSNDAAVYADGVKIAEQTVVLVVQAPKLTLTRQRERVEGEGEFVPGDTIRYTIRYGNGGTADATNVVIEETLEEKVVLQVNNVTGGGIAEGATLRWSLGTVPAGASGEVSYEATLKPALSLGTIEVCNRATIHADDVEHEPALDCFFLRTPLLSIERKREDVNGGAIQPGDTLRFTVCFANSGEVAASDVVMRDDFCDAVVAEVNNISAGGREVEGAVEWELEEPLKPDEEKTFSYEVRLISEIGESTKAVNRAIALIGGLEVADSKTEMIIEPVEQAPIAEQPQVFERRPEIIAVLVGVSSTAALLAVVGLAVAAIMKSQWKDGDFQGVIEAIAVIIIVEAVLVLAMGSGIKQDGAVSILSGIAGYILGRSRR